MRKTRATPSGVPTVIEELYDLVEGGPPDTSVQPPRPQPDWHEQNNLLAGSLPLSFEAAMALQNLRDNLNVDHPCLVR